MSSRPDTGNSETRFTAWLHLGISKPSTSGSHLMWLYSSGRVYWEKHRWCLNLHHLGNPRACASTGQLQTTLEHHHPVPAQLILHRGQRLVISGHSQSLQLTGLGKSLPLISQQQPRINYKRRVYSAHTKGVPQVPSLGDRGGCLCDWTLQDTYYIRPHYQDLESRQLYIIHRNKHREAAKMRRQRNMAQMKEWFKTPEKS